MSRPAPRQLTDAMSRLTSRLAPAGTLARVQEVWPGVVGQTIATSARPTAEREGVLSVLCEAAVWAQELDMMSGDIVERLNAALGTEAIRELRCTTA